MISRSLVISAKTLFQRNCTFIGSLDIDISFGGGPPCNPLHMPIDWNNWYYKAIFSLKKAVCSFLYPRYSIPNLFAILFYFALSIYHLFPNHMLLLLFHNSSILGITYCLPAIKFKDLTLTPLPLCICTHSDPAPWCSYIMLLVRFVHLTIVIECLRHSKLHSKGWR